MKKTMALCVAAILAVGVSTTAYAAPLQTASTCRILRQCAGGQEIDVLRQMLIQRLEECLPGCSQLLPGCPSKPAEKPDTPAEKPGTSLPGTPDTEKPDDKPVIDNPVVDKPDTDKPIVDKPDTDKPVVDKPAEKPEQPEQPDDNQTNTDTEGVSAYAAKVVELVNAERAKAGLSALTLDLTASQAAQVRAAEIRSSFSHTRPNGKNCFTALAEAGVEYRAAGENIAAGQRTPEEVVTAWMNSEGHRKNILGSQFTAIGVGYLEGGYWTQFFIG